MSDKIYAPAIRTQHGIVRGIWQTGSSAAYLGIPYAAAPVGERRFQAPRPPEPWMGVRDATVYGPTPQKRPFAEVTTIPEPSIPGEDILNLNVFTPAPGDRLARLPVLVWIHGGGYFAGSPASPWYNGRSFNENGVILVTISYRLGFEGFGWLKGAPLNRGILDQIAALHWVQDNILEFGGDPGNVTIAGQSAGGGSVLALLTSPRASGLFHAAIPMSSAMDMLDLQTAQSVGESLARHFNIRPSEEEWRHISGEAFLDAERLYNQIPDYSVPFRVREALQLYAKGRITNLAFRPVVDGDILPYQMFGPDALTNARTIPVLIGTTRNEFSFAAQNDTPSSEALVDEFAAMGLRHVSIQRFVDEIDRIGRERAWSQLMTSLMFRVGLVRFTHGRRRVGAGDITWTYDFAAMSSRARGSFHCHDIPYFFNLLSAPNVEQQLGSDLSLHLAERMHQLICHFVTYHSVPYPPASHNVSGAIRLQPPIRYDDLAYEFERDLASVAGLLDENTDNGGTA
ncbi:MAG: carboxylesterase family protein [Alicyclobacillus mali]|uniref:carboxylesterase/lipase family protein n=3 Tax=Alicyclobacillus mali (ex Roth et al. 2021) TaxID=1123961 RepID=UPI0023F4CE49|nr:carboxylesterase family protein [Alicyclobacillus mali (ex Roth et al. 2021)]MCL6489944.1 carboxylesterase family protein [Alicyclobacillus mali (ex Roth et al. 2021)]